MMNYLCVFLGSGLGGMTRYGVGVWISHMTKIVFPIGTLLINITGCFLMGLLTTLILHRNQPFHDQMVYLVLVGFLGGYTTFSTFSIDTLRLFNQKLPYLAMLNIILSFIFCMLSVWMGSLLGTSIHKLFK